MNPDGPAVRLLTGDACQVLASLPAASAACVVTSPPYFGLRDYGEPGQYGLEASPQEYADNLRAVFREIRRVLSPDGTAWLNLGDRYSGGTRRSYGTHSGKVRGCGLAAAWVTSGLPGKNLLGIPWLIAFALRQDGWLLRSAIVWHKPNAMPESVCDRMSCRYEVVFLLARQPQHWHSLDPAGEPPGNLQTPWSLPPDGQQHAAACQDGKPARIRAEAVNGTSGTIAARGTRDRQAAAPTRCRCRAAHTGNPHSDDVWSIPTRPLREAHFAAFPIDIPLRCIAAGCPPGGMVLDPFSGSGTTGLAALQLGRRYTGIDINPRYHDLARQRLRRAAARSHQAAARPR